MASSSQRFKILLFVGLLAAGACGLAAFWMSRPPALPSEPVAATPPRLDVAAIRAKAEAGDAAAQAQLGRICADQLSNPKRYAEAGQWFARAADQGNADAQASLAELYEAGQGVPQDAAKAIALYRQAAQQGHAGALYALGFNYETGRGVPQDQAEAAKWFRQASERGHPLAQYEMGQRHELGVGVPVDRVEALKWLELAARQGQTDAAARRDTLKKTLTRQQIAAAAQAVEAFTTSPSIPRSPPSSQ